MFNIGKLYMTSGISNAIENNFEYFKEILKCFENYLVGNWGDLTECDKRVNDNALRTANERLLGAYKTSKGRIYITTEDNRSRTIIMFDEEW